MWNCEDKDTEYTCKEDKMKIEKIEIEFPFPVKLPKGFDQTLSALINMVCEKYQEDHPGRRMWPAGHGAKPLWREPEEPEFDNNIFHISIAEREASPKERL